MRSKLILPVFSPQINNTHIQYTEYDFTIVVERFVVFWLTVTFHQQNLIADKCANVDLKIAHLSATWRPIGAQIYAIKSVTSV